MADEVNGPAILELARQLQADAVELCARAENAQRAASAERRRAQIARTRPPTSR